MTANATTAIFEASASTPVAVDPVTVYRFVSDLRNSGAWSPECGGGDWVLGKPGQLGAVFRGRNRRELDVVSWAPVVRGEWRTEAEVIAADEPTSFSWAMRDSSGRTQESVWSFLISETSTATVLTHTFVMRSLTEGMKSILNAIDERNRDRFVPEWQSKLEKDLQTSVEAIRRELESRN